MNQPEQLLWKTQLTDEEINFTKTEIMAKLVATLDEQNYPHLSFITSNWAISPQFIKWGEFVAGRSKKNVLERPKQGILYMTAKMPFQFLQVKVNFDHLSTQGEDAADFNQMNLFRYNTYMRIHKVYYNKIISTRKIRNIKIFGILKGIIRNWFPKRGTTGNTDSRLSSLGQQLYSGALYPKFLSYVDHDGYPVIFPVFQARSIEQQRIFIPFTQFKRDLLALEEGQKIGMFAMDFETVSQMIKGEIIQINNNYCVIDITSVYNSMPPKVGEIYPIRPSAKKVTEFL